MRRLAAFYRAGTCRQRREPSLADVPITFQRASAAEWARSRSVSRKSSSSTVIASGKPTPCLRRLASAFSGSQGSLTRANVATDAHRTITSGYARIDRQPVTAGLDDRARMTTLSSSSARTRRRVRPGVQRCYGSAPERFRPAAARLFTAEALERTNAGVARRGRSMTEPLPRSAPGSPASAAAPARSPPSSAPSSRRTTAPSWSSPAPGRGRRASSWSASAGSWRRRAGLAPGPRRRGTHAPPRQPVRGPPRPGAAPGPDLQRQGREGAPGAPGRGRRRRRPAPG